MALYELIFFINILAAGKHTTEEVAPNSCSGYLCGLFL